MAIGKGGGAAAATTSGFVTNEDFISLDFEDEGDDAAAARKSKGKEKASKAKAKPKKKDRDNKGKKRKADEAGLDRNARDKERVTPWARAVPWEACLDPAQM
jgi:hypothetical protein